MAFKGPNSGVIERLIDSVHRADGILSPRCLVNTDVGAGKELGFLTKTSIGFEHTNNSR